MMKDSMYEKKGTFNTNDEESYKDKKAPSAFKREDDQNTEGSMSSNDASSTRSVMRQLKALTKSMYTTVTPSSVRNLTVGVHNFCTYNDNNIHQFLYWQRIVQSLQNNVALVESAQLRESSIAYISSYIRELCIINNNTMLSDTRDSMFNNVGFPALENKGITDYKQWLNQSLWTYSNRLRNAQNIIGMIPDTLNSTLNEQINYGLLSLDYGLNNTALGQLHRLIHGLQYWP